MIRGDLQARVSGLDSDGVGTHQLNRGGDRRPTPGHILGIAHDLQVARGGEAESVPVLVGAVMNPCGAQDGRGRTRRLRLEKAREPSYAISRNLTLLSSRAGQQETVPSSRP